MDHQEVLSLKLDLSKAYDYVRHTFLWLDLVQMGMSLLVINWIMGWIQSISFVVLINGALSMFSWAFQGLHQGCPLASFLFIIITDAPSSFLIKARRQNTFQVIKVALLSLSHILSMVNVLFFRKGSVDVGSTLKSILDLFCKATGMVIDIQNYCCILDNVPNADFLIISSLFPFPQCFLADGFF